MSNDNCEKEKNSEQACPTLYPEKQKYVHCTQRKIGHLFHDKLRDRKSQDFVKAISTYTLYLYLTGSWTNSSLGLQWKYSKNIQKSQSEIKQNSFLNSYNYSLRQRRQGDCRVIKKKKKLKKKKRKKRKKNCHWLSDF